MKQIFTFFLMMTFAFSVNAQFIWNDFDANQNVAFTGGAPDPTIIANPYSGGINTSANVAEWVREGWEWSHAKAIAPGTIDFTTGTTFTLKAYSPITTTVKFKLEGPGGTTEVDQTVNAGAWELLSFDFPSAPNDAYNTIVIFFAPATWGTETFYFDDVEGPEYEVIVPKPYIAANVQDNFENDGWGTIDEWFFQDPDNDPLTITSDPVDPSNNVADYYRDGSFQWTNAQAVLNHRMNLTERNTFELKVYFPSSNDYTNMPATAAIKLQNSELGGNAWTTQFEVVETVTTFDSWVTISYDFSGAFDRTDFDQIVIQLGGEGHNNVGQFYFDDLELLPVVYPEPAYIYNDFDANQNHDFSGYPNIPTIVTNPDQSGINTSANSAEWIRSTDQWAHIFTILDGPINFSNGTNFQIKVHSPISCDVLFKLENQDNPGVFVEQTATILNANEWALLNFNFPTAQSQTYDKIIIFLDFASTNDNTFYIDDIEGPEYDEPKSILELDVQDNFENDGWSTIDYWIFQDPNMDTLIPVTDPVNSNNTVGDYNRSGGFEWANAQTILDHILDLSERNKFELDVYFPSSNDYTGPLTPTVAIKLQNSLLGGNAWTTQAEVINTVTVFDEWVTVLFDFESWNATIDYDQIVVQFGGEGHWVPAQFYFDNLYLKHVPYITVESPNGGEMIDQGSNFDLEWDFDYWDIAGDIKIEIMKGNETPDLLANRPVTDTLFNWWVYADLEPGSDYRIITTSLDNSILTDTSDNYFTIVEVTVLEANFFADPTTLASGDSTFFTDQSTGGPTDWNWTFEGGTPGTFSGQEPPYIHYETAGLYSVTLEINDGDVSDTKTIEDYILVGDAPVSDFEASIELILIGESVEFTNLSSGENLTYEWYFEGGIPETSAEENPGMIQYDVEGVFDVSLIVTNEYGTDTKLMEDFIDVRTGVGIDDPMELNVKVFPNPVTDQLNIHLKENTICEVQVSDLRGLVVNKVQLSNENNVIDMSTLQSGIYILSVRDLETNEMFAKKIIVRN